MAIVNDAQVIIKNVAKVLAPVLVLSLLPMVNGSVANAANAPSVTIGSKQLVSELPFVDPIYVGYKGPTSFIPAAVANKKDKFGCVLRQRMIIDLATKKPKVGKGCRMSGGVWTTGLGAKVTNPSSLILTPIMPYKDAWGQGAFAWTPEQRLAWATNTKVSTSKTRAKAVTNLQVTQTLVSKIESREVKYLISEFNDIQKEVDDIYINAKAAIAAMCNVLDFGCMLSIANMAQVGVFLTNERLEEAQANLGVAQCQQIIQLASNVKAWGLSLDPEVLKVVLSANKDCGNTPVGVELLYASAGINPVKSITAVPTGSSDGGLAPDAGLAPAAGGAVKLFSDYPDASSGVAVRGDTFGIHAPVDWGTPSVGASWIRLWDAGVSWAQMEPTQGNIDFTKLRASIEEAERFGARVLYVLGDTPKWANGGYAGNISPSSNDSALNFIRALKNEFGSRISAYEVWNEGNLESYWTGSQYQLGQLTKGIKDVVGSTSMVLAASTTTRATNAFASNYGEYLSQLSTLGWPVDGYTVHSYPIASAGPVERVNEIGQFKALLALRGAPVKPIWDTELNYGLAGLGEGVRRIDDATGAAYIAQSYIQSIQYGVDVTFWYLWTGTRGYYDLLGAQFDPSTSITNSVWNNLRAALEGTRMTRCNESGNVYACQFVDRSGQPFTLMWTRAGTSEVNVRGLGTQVCDLTGNRCSPVIGGTMSIGILPVRVPFSPEAPVPTSTPTTAPQPTDSGTITINGQSVTISGKPGIEIGGATTGFKAGDVVVPWVRFPGETSYTKGSLRPIIDANGEFVWSRKTTKKLYIYFTSADDKVKSNVVIIQNS